jgi:uncharacterized protein YjiS (DUF1127 family)
MATIPRFRKFQRLEKVEDVSTAGSQSPQLSRSPSSTSVGGGPNPCCHRSFVSFSWKRYERAVQELSRLSDRELADIGITRGDIHRIAKGQSRCQCGVMMSAFGTKRTSSSS